MSRDAAEHECPRHELQSTFVAKYTELDLKKQFRGQLSEPREVELTLGQNAKVLTCETSVRTGADRRIRHIEHLAADL